MDVLPWWAALLIAALVAALAASLYAALLSTEWGVRITLAKTHYTVVLGVLLTLGCLAIFDWQAAAWALLFFVVTGIPMVVRSEWFDLRERFGISRRARGEDDEAA